MNPVYIHIDQVEEFFRERLIALGYAPGEAECEVIADIMFDYLISIGVMEEEGG